ncbi:MAG: TlpA family protein disulfide reductase [Chloroflexi bacterium]|nr:TlpA family protein disulfide reductase [Chloroflexota bacterium]
MTSTLERTPAGERPLPLWTPLRLLSVGFVVVVALALLALLGYGLLVAGKPSGAVPVELRPARPFTLSRLDGGELRLADLRGKVVLLNFWASWCGPCLDEAPVLERAARQYAERGVVVVGVNIWDSESDARAFLERFGISYPNGRDARGTIAIDYGVSGVPETYFIDRDGRLVRKWIGPLNERQLTAWLDELVR